MDERLIENSLLFTGTGIFQAMGLSLRPEDCALLAPAAWLNDQLIAYYFEQLGAAADSRGASVLLLEPSLVHAAAILRDANALREMTSVPSTKGEPALIELMRTRRLVLMPVNDKGDPSEHEGGGHWSLLVFRRGDAGAPPRFEHYDSCKGANSSQARAVAQCFATLLEPNTAGATTQLVSMRTPQQVNGYDCGVYVLCIAEVLCVTADPAQAAQEIQSITPEAATVKRDKFRQMLQR
ncbi:hypothetical protein AB1Y20_006378 [Prymnesium parvum]|uniref:Ubiquitin-like protease family profile domain-containing protein n=1 Tax=Prymnesium parvum TaxID=97485 RepID=A0AB34J2K0_PRYPA